MYATGNESENSMQILVKVHGGDDVRFPKSVQIRMRSITIVVLKSNKII